MNLRRFIDDWGSIAVNTDLEGRVTLHDGPPVVWVNRSIRGMSDFHWGDFGYLPVYRNRNILGRRYRAVWPLPLWAVHVIGHGAYLLLWGALQRLYDWGLVTVDAEEYDDFRWRDLRPAWGKRGK
jgi:hypothetical protein